MSSVVMILVDNGVVFNDSFTVINPQGTSKERGACGSNGGLRAGSVHSCGGGGMDLNLLWPLHQSGSVGAARKRPTDLIAPALSLFSQSVTTLELRDTLHQETSPIPYVTAHVHTHTHTQGDIHVLTLGRGNVVTTALNWEVKGYHYKWLTLTFSQSTGTQITHTYPVTLNPSLISCYIIIHLWGWGVIWNYKMGPIFSPSECFLCNLSGYEPEQGINENKKECATTLTACLFRYPGHKPAIFSSFCWHSLTFFLLHFSWVRLSLQSPELLPVTVRGIWFALITW